MVSRTVTVLMAMVGGMGPATMGNGTPAMRTLGSVGWVDHVLSAEAPQMDEETRLTVATTVVEQSRQHDLDPALVLAMMKVESGFDMRACSPRGARGLMQLMPHVARSMTDGQATHETLMDPVVNIRLGTSLLKSLIKQHKGNLPRALAAYNMGSRKVYALMRENEAPHHDTDWRYTRQVLRAMQQMKQEHALPMLATNEPAYAGAGSMD